MSHLPCITALFQIDHPACQQVTHEHCPRLRSLHKKSGSAHKSRSAADIPPCLFFTATFWVIACHPHSMALLSPRSLTSSIVLICTLLITNTLACGKHGVHIPYHNQAVSHGYCSESFAEATTRCAKTMGENTAGFTHCVASAEKVYVTCTATADQVQQLRVQQK
ncbi:hypothetical protein DFJ77DRAFT_285770 [Powellomyces hirtus]|nr:hypothetical protein DFJ77DRAFT_285770 [Powellomyces hirtus]